MIYPICIRPVRLNRYGAEALFLDKPFRNGCPERVELVRPMRRLAEEHERRIPDRMEQCIMIAPRPLERVPLLPEQVPDPLHQRDVLLGVGAVPGVPLPRAERREPRPARSAR